MVLAGTVGGCGGFASCCFSSGNVSLYNVGGGAWIRNVFCGFLGWAFVFIGSWSVGLRAPERFAGWEEGWLGIGFGVWVCLPFWTPSRLVGTFGLAGSGVGQWYGGLGLGPCVGGAHPWAKMGSLRWASCFSSMMSSCAFFASAITDAAAVLKLSLVGVGWHG